MPQTGSTALTSAEFVRSASMRAESELSLSMKRLAGAQIVLGGSQPVLDTH